MIDPYKKPQAAPAQARPASQVIAEFPRRHLLVASAALALLFVTLMITPSRDAAAKRISQPLSIELGDSLISRANNPSHNLSEQRDSSTTPPPSSIEPQWTSIKVGKGDTLAKIFQRVQLNGRDVYEITSSSPDAKKLAQIFPGQTLEFKLNSDGKLDSLKHQKDLLRSTHYQRQADGFAISQHQREPEVRQRYGTATINSSLFAAANRAGLDQNVIMALANVFGGVVDFVYDVRSGDSFDILFEEHYVDGIKVGNGPILAAQFSNQGQVYKAFRYTNSNGNTGYFNEQGISMRKAFLRAPLDFTRISSNFNPNRLHPVFKTNRPHRGIDYAASRGTPVFSAGDGRVRAAGYSKANGNYVFIKHPGGYETKYLHLHKRNVKTGQKVKQQQIIGSVGSTGYATGPHLHYEFLVNGVHRNPRTILRKLPKAHSIVKGDRDLFMAQISPLKMQLTTYGNHHKLALNEQTHKSNTL